MLGFLSRFFVFMSIGFIEIYRKIAPKRIRQSCRYTPTCSEYAVQALERYGFIKGWLFAAKRILRCRPPYGGHDSVHQNMVYPVNLEEKKREEKDNALKAFLSEKEGVSLKNIEVLPWVGEDKGH